MYNLIFSSLHEKGRRCTCVTQIFWNKFAGTHQPTPTHPPPPEKKVNLSHPNKGLSIHIVDQWWLWTLVFLIIIDSRCLDFKIYCTQGIYTVRWLLRLWHPRDKQRLTQFTYDYHLSERWTKYFFKNPPISLI